MSYDKGNFYHVDGVQYIEGVTLVDCLTNGVKILTGAGVPIGNAPAGALYVRTGAGNVGLYINIGTEEAASWAKFNPIDEEAMILAYAIANQEEDATIDSTAHTVDVLMPYGTDVTGLVATFTLSTDATAEVGEVDQDSGVTENDFTTPVTYTITAEDGTSSLDWEVTVTLAPNHEAELSVMTMPAQIGETVYDVAEKTISITLPALTDPTALIATFTVSAEASVFVGEVPQESGVTANDFTSPVVYTVLADDGVTSEDYTVTVLISE